MVEGAGGVVSATSGHVTVRVPYAIGVACANGSQTTLSLWPVDSTAYATAGFSGYAWRGSLGKYTYVEAGASGRTGQSRKGHVWNPGTAASPMTSSSWKK